jgi:hypothetical protein
MTNELKKEIIKTLIFFIECDIKTEGKITEETKRAFKTQKIDITKYCPIKYI